MEGIVHKKRGEYTKKVEQDSGYLGLLTSINGVELSELFIHKGKRFLLVPGKDATLREFFYILEGMMREEGEQFELTQGDYFYIEALEKPVYCLALEDTKLLYMTTESVFFDMSDTIEKLTSIMTDIENKDQYTKGHCCRVIEWAPLVARKIGLSSKQVEVLTYASLFHDLGKIEIPDHILHKTSALTFEEYEKIKDHPTLGKIIAEANNFPEIGKVIEQHHERLDGSGYPNGLTDKDISIEAKIIAVIDSYDAMTSDRPYRTGLSQEEAVEELLKYKNMYYDAEIVDAFVSLLGLA